MTSSTSRRVVADANVLLSAALGHAARKVFQKARIFHVITTDVAMQDVWEYLPIRAKKSELDLADVLEAFGALPVEVVSPAGYRVRVKEAERLIADRDPDDVSVLALALKRRLPVWSNDNDFDETGVTVYTTAELLKVLGFTSVRRH